jgi:hypothetical protein
MENKSFDINLNSIAQSMAVPDVSIIEFTVNLIIALFLAFIIKIFYENFAKSLSNRKIFSNILIYIALTTTVIITIVKSSLALSLGLVGALSIVRFRTAIKDPEELSYLFISIAIGLGMGANQRIITVIGVIIILTVVYFLRVKDNKIKTGSLFLILSVENSDEKLEINKITNILDKFSEFIEVKKVEQGNNRQEISFNIILKNSNEIDIITKELNACYSNLEINIIDSYSVFN